MGINCSTEDFFKISFDQNLDQQEDDKLILNSTTESFTVMLIPFCSINFINSIPDATYGSCLVSVCTLSHKTIQRIMMIW